MRLPQTLFFLLTFLTTIHALALPAYLDSAFESSKELFKRKGGGGGGGRGGGSSSSSSSSGSSSGSSRGSGSSSSSSGSSSGSRGSSGTGTGAPRAYGGGYGGGATAPYAAGGRSGRGVAPVLIGGAALAVFPGLWLAGAYAYSYPGSYRYYNRTSNRNESKPIECLCAPDYPCGCDPKNETTYMDAVANDLAISRVADINGTSTLVVNGTLPKGTTAPGQSSATQTMIEMSGFWVVIAGVIYTVSFM